VILFSSRNLMTTASVENFVGIASTHLEKYLVAVRVHLCYVLEGG
jgi:hypothetical protein